MGINTNILIAGGKTGGHLFPGIAVAQALESALPQCKILFVGTNTPFEVNTLKRYGYAHKAVAAAPVKGGTLFGRIRALILILVAFIQSLFIILRFRPGFVLGVGGYSSFALVLAARILGIPRAIQEQNTVPGITNRLLARFVDTVFTAFEHTRHMPETKTRCVGNPMRKDQPGKSSAPLPRVDRGAFILLVTGGSQGAASINRAMLEAAPLLGDSVFIIHQTGTRDEQQVKGAYGDMGVKAHAAAFFHDMPAVLNLADLVIARAGAGTLSELCIKGLPAILVPFPHAADDHQTHNAKALEQKGGAMVIADEKLSGEGISHAVTILKSDPEKLESMARAMEAAAMPHAAETIAAHILRQIKG